MLDRMEYDQWKPVISPKVYGTSNLDSVFSDSRLDFFIILSSVTGILGNFGQANYTAAGTFQDALSWRRVSRGQPSVSIDLGSIPSVGLAKELGVLNLLEKAGYRPHSLPELLRIFEMAIRHPRHGQIVTGIRPWTEPGDLPWRQEPRFLGLQQRATDEGLEKQAASKNRSLKDSLHDDSDVPPLVKILEALVARVAEMSLLAPTDVSPDQELAAYGVDSLVAVELRNWLAANTTSEISIFDITQSRTLRHLAQKVAEKV